MSQSDSAIKSAIEIVKQAVCHLQFDSDLDSGSRSCATLCGNRCLALQVTADNERDFDTALLLYKKALPWFLLGMPRCCCAGQSAHYPDPDVGIM